MKMKKLPRFSDGDSSAASILSYNSQEYNFVKKDNILTDDGYSEFEYSVQYEMSVIVLLDPTVPLA